MFVQQFTNQPFSTEAASGNPVAVFDSGIGGISVLRELHRLLPHENYWYYGDNAHAPYGTQDEGLVCRYASDCIGMMIRGGAKAVVIACNTATSAAAPRLRQLFPSIPIIGMEPEIKTPAMQHHNRVLVMATPMTLQLEKFRQLFELYRDKAEFLLQPCPGLAALIEEGEFSAPRLRQLVIKLLGSYFDPARPIDAIVLGCTHYLHIKPLLRELFGDAIAFYDGASGASRELKRRLSGLGLINESLTEGEIMIEGSKDSASFRNRGQRLFSQGS